VESADFCAPPTHFGHGRGIYSPSFAEHEENEPDEPAAIKKGVLCTSNLADVDPKAGKAE
jgi:hypothetical protein